MDNRDEFEAWYRDNSFEYSAISNGECFYIWQAACASQWRLIAEALERWTCSAPSTGQKKGLGWSVGYPTTGEAEMKTFAVFFYGVIIGFVICAAGVDTYCKTTWYPKAVYYKWIGVLP